MSKQSCWKENEQEDDFKKTAVTDDYHPKRVILHLDVDGFEVQFWMIVFRPDLIGKNVPVVVINSDGIILSVNYTAKILGVKRGDEYQALTDARLLCSKSGSVLEEITAGERYGKADNFFPLTESNRIVEAVYRWFAILKEWKPDLYNSASFKIERISRDELSIDVTDFVDAKLAYFKKTFVKENSLCIPNSAEVKILNKPKVHPNDDYSGQPTTTMEGRNKKLTGQELIHRVEKVYPLRIEKYHVDELRLIHGALIADWIIHCVELDTPYRVSVGVGHSKSIAKLACDLKKPSGISIITDVALPRLSKTISFQDLPGFCGKIGEAVQNLLTSKLGKKVKINDILQASNDGINLVDIFRELDFPDYETMALDLYNMCQFKDESRVTQRIHPETISTSLSFKDCERKGEFHESLVNIVKDMKRRINYYKRLGWIAQELAIKADYKSPRSQDRCNVVSLPLKRDDFINGNFIYQTIVEFIEQNRLERDEILKIYLTAKNILANEKLNESKKSI